MPTGKLKSLFDQGAEYGDYIDTFFSTNPQPRLSWIHDLGKQDYQHAASALLAEAQVECNRETRHVCLHF
jgi:nuclear pore complex protein Nup133